MASTIGRYLVALLLLGFTAFGFLGSYGFLKDHPFLQTIISIVTDPTGSTVVPGAPSPFKRTYTGYEPVDGQLRVLIAFFSAIIDDGELPNTTSAFNYWAMAQLGTGWTLILLESLRLGNAWNFSSFKLVAVAGFFIQTLTWTVTVPVWLSLHLLFSPVARLDSADYDSKSRAAGPALHVRPWDLKLLPVTVILAYVVPCVLMGKSEAFFPADSAMHYDLIAFWQPFPIWNVLLQVVLYAAVYLVRGPTPSFGDAKTGKKPGVPGGKAYAAGASKVYQFAIGMAALTHIPVLACCLLPTATKVSLAESLSVSKETAEAVLSLNFKEVFVPYSIYDMPAVGAAGTVFSTPILNFLQYDIHTGTAALLFWAMYIHGFGFATLVKTAVWTALAGPAGAAVALVWDRDVALLAGIGEEEEAAAKKAEKAKKKTSSPKPKERYGPARSKKA